jgi:hypothetical protein
MPSPPDRAFHEWSDIGSNFLRASNWIAAGGSLVALYAALQNASNANLLYETSGAPIVGTVSPTDALFPLVQDLALFNFQTVPGSRCQLVVPAPLAVWGRCRPLRNPICRHHRRRRGTTHRRSR